MPKKYSILLFLIAFTSTVHGQDFEEELREAIQTKPKLELRLDSRNTFINQSGVRVYSLKGGIQFDNKLSFGLGYNQLWSDLHSERLVEGQMVRTKLEFFTISPYLEYVFYRDDQWELSIPLQIGMGSSYYKNDSGIGAKELNRQFVMTYEPAITFQYRFLRYFGAGFGVGYRLMVVNNSKVEEKFTSPVYIFKWKIYFQDIIKDIGGE